MNYQQVFRGIVGVTLSFMLLGLLSSTAYATGPGPGEAYRVIPAASHCAGISNEAAGSILLAANPELSTACRYASRVSEKPETVDPVFPNITGPDAARSADNVQQDQTGLSEASQALPESNFAAANPEAMRARSHTVVENGVGLQQKTDAIQRFGLAEVREAEKDTVLADHKLWMPAYLGRITADEKDAAPSRGPTMHDIQRLDPAEYMEAAEK